MLHSGFSRTMKCSLSNRTGVMQKSVLACLAALMAICGAGFGAGCQRLGGRTVRVEFRSVEGILGGEVVYLAGIAIGETGEPRLVEGHAVVPVMLFRPHRDALPPNAVFLLKSDRIREGRNCLTVYRGSPDRTPPARREVFSGASNRFELILLLGAELADQTWKETVQ